MIHIWYANLTMYDEWHLHSCFLWQDFRDVPEWQQLRYAEVHPVLWWRGKNKPFCWVGKRSMSNLIARSGWQLYVCNDVTPDINVKAILIKHFQINNHIDRARDRTRSNIGAIYSSQELALSQDLKMMRLKFYSNNWCTEKKTNLSYCDMTN